MVAHIIGDTIIGDTIAKCSVHITAPPFQSIGRHGLVRSINGNIMKNYSMTEPFHAELKIGEDVLVVGGKYRGSRATIFGFTPKMVTLRVNAFESTCFSNISTRLYARQLARIVPMEECGVPFNEVKIGSHLFVHGGKYEFCEATFLGSTESMVRIRLSRAADGSCMSKETRLYHRQVSLVIMPESVTKGITDDVRDEKVHPEHNPNTHENVDINKENVGVSKEKPGCSSYYGDKVDEQLSSALDGTPDLVSFLRSFGVVLRGYGVNLDSKKVCADIIGLLLGSID